MTRRLFYLNAALAVIALALGFRLLNVPSRQKIWLVEASRGYIASTASSPVSGVSAASYADVALRLLFSRDRNPTEIPPAPAPPPQDPPPPPFPKASGVMMVETPRVILTAAGEG